jgi:eukaryotic-like serine/threonine-protein kinase
MVNKSFVFRFDGVEVREREFTLIKAGKLLTVEPKAFRALLFLLHNPQKLISKKELLDAVWGDTAVTEGSLTRCIWLLRQLLGDDIHNPRYIETVATVGYRFIGRVEASEEGPGEPAAIKEPDDFSGRRIGSRNRLPGWAQGSVEAAKGSTDSTGKPSKGSVPLAFGKNSLFGIGIAVVVLLGIGYVLFYKWRSAGRSGSNWVQVTNFPDYANSPALSADGRLLAFIRGPETFVTPGQIYVKVLPDGQPIELTHDNAPKMAPSFAPDGSRIAYTATNSAFEWNTWTVSVLGGEAQQMLPNAAALTWVDTQHILFSEMKTGVRMGLATATESRAEERDVYIPANEEGMAHRSRLSPDGKWVLISEMDNIGWRPCRVLAFAGNSSGQTVGPAEGSCTYAGWSPDGRWMYFSVDTGGGFHIWRQRFPKGEPEQITFGPTEEEGIAIAPDGKSLVTSVGIRQGSVWLHDADGDRQISGEGFAMAPGLGLAATARSVFSPDGKKLFYLVRKRGSRTFNSGELWMAELASGRTEVVLPGVLMSDFDVAPDGKRVTYASPGPEGSSRVWVVPLDRSAPPQLAASFEAERPSFGSVGDLFFLGRDGGSAFIYRMQPNDATPRRVSRDPVSDFRLVSPDGEWFLSSWKGLTAVSLRSSSTVRICDFCDVGWGPGGKFFYLRLRGIGHLGGGKVFAIALPFGKSLPRLPASGIRSEQDIKGPNVAAVVDMIGKLLFAPGPMPSTYAYTRTTVQRNLFCIPLN